MMMTEMELAFATLLAAIPEETLWEVECGIERDYAARMAERDWDGARGALRALEMVKRERRALGA